MFTLTNKQDIEDFTVGCCFFGTGGGGSPKFGQRMLIDALEAGKKIQVVDSVTIKDEEWIVCPYLMGTSGPETEEAKLAKLKHGLVAETVMNMPAAATNLLLKHAKQSVNLSAIIAYEIGGAATASAVATAAWLDIPVIDADFVGRSVPEATQMLPAIYGLDLCPTASADAFGNETMIYQTINRHLTERIGKFLASASFGLIGQATLLHPKKQLKPYMIPGTLSKALAVGKALRINGRNSQEIEKNIFDLIGSKKIFSGVISEFIGYEKEGYYVGDIVIEGQDEYKNSKLKIWFKNENHIAWLNDKVHLTSPDLISMTDKLSNIPYVNNQLQNGLHVTVYGTPSSNVWYKEEALQAQCPRYYGFDFDPCFMGKGIVD